MDQKGSLLSNNTVKWWQSRTVWTALVAGGVVVGLQAGADAELVDQIKTIGETLIAVFLRLGVLNATQK